MREIYDIIEKVWEYFWAIWQYFQKISHAALFTIACCHTINTM